jgi:hypothetical protein
VRVRNQALLLAACAPLFIACASDPPADYPPRPAPPTGTTADGSVAVAADPNAYADTDPSALTDFHSALDSHGEWVDDPTYGTIWVPNSEEVGTDFAPYNTRGHWAYDNDEYVWVSDYDWGWAPFHYGRWTYVNQTGWGWVPGRTYAGAWVEWRDGSAETGWAPTPPTYGWRGGVAVGLPAVPAPQYVYTAHGNVFSPNVHGQLLGGSEAAQAAAHTTPYVRPGSANLVGRGPATGVAGHGPPPSTIGVAANEVPHTNGVGPGAGSAGAANEVPHGGGAGGAPPGRVGSANEVPHGGAGGEPPGRVGSANEVPHGSGVGVGAGTTGAANEVPHGGTAPVGVGAAGVARAQTFAQPNTAVAAGAHPPSNHFSRVTAVAQTKAPPTHYTPAAAPHVGVRGGVRRK